MYDVLVTRHAAIATYLKELGIIDDNTEIVMNATKSIVEGKRVAGVLPYDLAALCSVYREIVVRVPVKLRGKTLTVEEIKPLVFIGEEYIIRDVKHKDSNAIALATYIVDYDSEWDDFKDYMFDGGDPFSHIVFTAYEVLGRTKELNSLIMEYAKDCYKIKFLEYVSRM